jgi:hypothetical protein
MTLNRDNLNDAIDFDSPFRITETGELEPVYVYAPRVEHDETDEYTIDGIPRKSQSTWEAFSTGYSGQDRYRGPVMHASEYIGNRLADDILNTPGVYLVTAVEAPCYDTDTPCFPDEPNYCQENGCDAEPAGWIVLNHARPWEVR